MSESIIEDKIERKRENNSNEKYIKELDKYLDLKNKYEKEINKKKKNIIERKDISLKKKKRLINNLVGIPKQKPIKRGFNQK